MAIRVERLSSHSALVLLLAALLAPAGVVAQQVIPVQFSFSDPGARSMGFGGAFVALADDATAAFANPAGLVQLLRPEVSVEGRRWSYSTPFTEGGRLAGLPTGNGIDTTVGLRTATSEHKLTGLSFLSLVYPGDDWSLAFFRHEWANLEFFSETQGLFTGGPGTLGRFVDVRATSDQEFVSYGLSAAYRISDRFNLGLGVVYHDLSFEASETRFLPDDDTLASVFAQNSYLPERSVTIERSFGHATDWTFIAGFLWRLSESWSIGGVYRQGPEVEGEGEETAGEANDLGVPPGSVVFRGPGVLELPDFYGLGFAYRAPDGRLTVSFQWDRIEYSNSADSLRFDERTIDDVDELHLGAEYVFLGSTPIVAVRLGAWLDPDHQIRTTTDDPLDRALLPRGDDEMHYAAGLGVALQNFQIDLGVDFADRVDTVSLSAIYSF